MVKKEVVKEIRNVIKEYQLKMEKECKFKIDGDSFLLGFNCGTDYIDKILNGKIKRKW